MMITRLLNRGMPVAVMGTTLGLLGVASAGDTHDDGKHGDKGDRDDHGKHHDRDCDFDHDEDHDGDGKVFRFDMIVSPGAAKCLPKARARVAITPLGPVEKMRVKVCGLPRDTDFDFFVIQKPLANFGLSWYQGDIETGKNGTGEGTFIGRFNIETFIVAPVAPENEAPVIFVHGTPPNVFSDTKMNPATNPVHEFHLGLWFNSPEDAKKAGCPATVTPFNGEHQAGIQVLNTANFPNDAGPLINVP